MSKKTIVERFSLRDKEIMVGGSLKEFLTTFREAQREFELVGGKGVSFTDIIFYNRERSNYFSPRQLIEMWQYFKQEGFIHAAKES